MTVMEWVLMRWRGAPPVAAPQPAAAPVPRSKPRVPAEYLSLYTYLEHRYASTVVLTFDQMESLLGCALPGPARTEKTWWTSESAPAGGHADAWVTARRTAMPNLQAGTVAFERQS